jgi:hypothetical protein
MFPKGLLSPFRTGTDSRLALWKAQNQWPSDSGGYLFLPRALDRLGSALFGDQWLGTEPACNHLDPLPDWNDVGVGADVHCRAARILRDDCDAYKTRADDRRWSIAAPPWSSDPMPTDDEWSLAVELSKQEYALTRPLWDRYVICCNTMACGLANGLISSVVRDVDGGPYRWVEAGLWISEDLRHRFDTARVNLDRPFFAKDAFSRDWCFIELASLDQFIDLLRSDQDLGESAPAVATTDDVNACATWLETLMRTSPQSSIATKTSLREEAIEKFGVSKHKFDVCWTQAITATGAQAWSKPGARGRLADSSQTNSNSGTNS